jgi:MATE family multidrug resistance protein
MRRLQKSWLVIFKELPAILRLALPLVLSLSAASLMGVTDTILLASQGTTALACVALVTSAGLIFHAALYGALATISVRVGYAFGAGESVVIAQTLRVGLLHGLTVGLVGCVLMIATLPLLIWLKVPLPDLALLTPYWIVMSFFLLPYCLLVVFKDVLEAIEKPWVAVTILLSAVLFNIPLSYVLIHGYIGLPAFGLLGAGIASAAAEFLALSLAIIYWRKSMSMAPYRASTFQGLLKVKTLLIEGLPLGVVYLAETSAVAIAAWMLAWIGESALAANQIVDSVAKVFYMLPLGIAAAVTIRLSQVSGSGEVKRIRAIGHATFICVTFWMLLSTLLLMLFGRTIAQALSKDFQVIAIAAPMFVAVALMQVSDGLQSTALGALRGLQDYRYPVIITMISYWILALPLSYWFAFHTELAAVGIWIGFGCGLTFAAIVLPLRFHTLSTRMINSKI